MTRCFPCYDGDRSGEFSGCNVPNDLLPSLGATAAAQPTAGRYLVSPYGRRYRYGSTHDCLSQSRTVR